MNKWWSKTWLALCSESASLPAYISVSANSLTSSVTFFFKRFCCQHELYTQDFRPAPGPKRKTGPLQISGPPHSLRPRTSLLFCRKVSPTQKITTVSPGSHLLSSTVTLKTFPLNEKLATPFEVQSKSHRLLIHTKSVMDYNVLLAEIKKTKLA